MTVSEGPAASRAAGWMVSPAWDLAFIVASPIAIVPALWLLTQSLITPEQLAIPVFAFATLGHHLPGYMRAYGDRDLFERFRLRFVVVPPLLFGVVLLLVEPSLFGLAMAPPSSLQLLLVLWGAWHGLMQIYGFMRIYDAKQGGVHGRTQRLDLAICFAIFVAGFLFSDARAFALLDLMLRAGLPVPTAEGLVAIRWGVAGAIAVTTIAYAANLVVERRQGRRMGGVKAVLALSTAGLYTYSGLVTTNILLGGAVFEVFHAIQYLAVVWYFNRRLEDRAGDAFGPLRFLFRDRWSSLVLYLAAIAAFGSLFLFMGTPQYGPIRAGTGGTETLYALFSAFFVTSSLLHYYYDGFIWKLHDRSTGSTIGLSRGLTEMSVPAIKHFGKWSGLAVGFGAIIALEVTTPAPIPVQVERLQALERLTPEVPELRRQLIALALAEERLDDAVAMAEDNIRLRPRSHESFADLGRVRVTRQEWPEAETAYRRALELHPSELVYRIDLARVVGQQGSERAGEAAALFQKALAERPDDAVLVRELARVEMQRGAAEAAVRLLEPVLASDPTALAVRGELVEALLLEGRPRRATIVAREGIEAAPEAAGAQRLLGAALRAANRHEAAAQALARARTLDPDLPDIDFETGQAWFNAGRYGRAEPYLQRASALDDAPAGALFMLGAIFFETERVPYAEIVWQRFVESSPSPAVGQRRLGSRLLDQGQNARAAEAFRQSLRLAPGHARTHYLLGRALLEAGDLAAAREQLEQAQRLGHQVPSGLWARAR